jgi:hypothetical protein
MFVCFTFVSSVVNLIYSKQRVLLKMNTAEGLTGEVVRRVQN